METQHFVFRSSEAIRPKGRIPRVCAPPQLLKEGEKERKSLGRRCFDFRLRWASAISQGKLAEPEISTESLARSAVKCKTCSRPVLNTDIFRNEKMQKAVQAIAIPTPGRDYVWHDLRIGAWKEHRSSLLADKEKPIMHNEAGATLGSTIEEQAVIRFCIMLMPAFCFGVPLLMASNTHKTVMPGDIFQCRHRLQSVLTNTRFVTVGDQHLLGRGKVPQGTAGMNFVRIQEPVQCDHIVSHVEARVRSEMSKLQPKPIEKQVKRQTFAIKLANMNTITSRCVDCYSEHYKFLDTRSVYMLSVGGHERGPWPVHYLELSIVAAAFASLIVPYSLVIITPVQEGDSAAYNAYVNADRHAVHIAVVDNESTAANISNEVLVMKTRPTMKSLGLAKWAQALADMWPGEHYMMVVGLNQLANVSLRKLYATSEDHPVIFHHVEEASASETGIYEVLGGYSPMSLTSSTGFLINQIWIPEYYEDASLRWSEATPIFYPTSHRSDIKAWLDVHAPAVRGTMHFIMYRADSLKYGVVRNKPNVSKSNFHRLWNQVPTGAHGSTIFEVPKEVGESDLDIHYEDLPESFIPDREHRPYSSGPDARYAEEPMVDATQTIDESLADLSSIPQERLDAIMADLTTKLRMAAYPPPESEQIPSSTSTASVKSWHEDIISEKLGSLEDEQPFGEDEPTDLYRELVFNSPGVFFPNGNLNLARIDQNQLWHRNAFLFSVYNTARLGWGRLRGIIPDYKRDYMPPIRGMMTELHPQTELNVGAWLLTAQNFADVSSNMLSIVSILLTGQIEFAKEISNDYWNFPALTEEDYGDVLIAASLLSKLGMVAIDALQETARNSSSRDVKKLIICLLYTAVTMWTMEHHNIPLVHHSPMATRFLSIGLHAKTKFEFSPINGILGTEIFEQKFLRSQLELTNLKTALVELSTDIAISLQGRVVMTESAESHSAESIAKVLTQYWSKLGLPEISNPHEGLVALNLDTTGTLSL